ncbi:MAG: PSD1 domain-containing protein [Planctomycetaceae bacterium]|nr:PSD1 domain-containing protein [Planctomycetaceae bacterium]
MSEPSDKGTAGMNAIQNVVLLLPVVCVLTTSSQAADIDFKRDIRPILSDKCFACHGPDAAHREADLRLDDRESAIASSIVPGEPDESELLVRVTSADADQVMPPPATRKRLTQKEVTLLREWIKAGAEYEPHWAFIPVAKQVPLPPTDAAAHWARNGIDAFVLQRLQAEHLTPAAAATREQWLRRVTFDLTGLPPTLEEIDAFITDESAQAFEAVVDRLLQTPACAERFAADWLDAARYADTFGYQNDRDMHVWPWRDWVIRSFQQNLSYKDFLVWQIAGDMLPEATTDQRLATTFNRLHRQTNEGGSIPEEFRIAGIADRTTTAGTAFLGLTLGCARCHDHKFDPVSTADYYALAGIFHSTLTTSHAGPGVWSAINEVRLPDRQSSPEEQARRLQDLHELRSRQQAIQIELTSLLLEIPGGSEANVLTREQPIAANEKGAVYEVSFKAGPGVWAGASQRTTADDGLQIDLLREDGSILTGFRHNPGPWSGTKNSQNLNIGRFSYTGDGSGGIRIRITSATPGSSRFGGAIDDVTITTGPATLFSEDFHALRRGPIEGVQADTGLRVFAQAVVPGWTGGGLNHSHAVELNHGDYAILFFGGGAKQLADAQPVTPAEKAAHSAAVEIEQQLQILNAKITRAEQMDAPEYALAVRDVDSPANSAIYRRGDFQSPGDVVPRGFLTAVSTATTHPIPNETSGRLQLARWLTDPQNPLTSRVLVNRIWQHLFGSGLVRTVDYFGVHGEVPGHPELLDFLAVRFRENDAWSLKKTVRRMVLSRTYQMASAHNAHAAELDPENRLMWQMPRRRLMAESIRDAMLSASGQLDSGRGGPSLGLELEGNINGLGGNVNPPSWAGKIPEEIRNRRSVYLPLRRQRPLGDLEILSVFDFPHPSDITGTRANTTVATQALFLLNAPFVKDQARQFAERLYSEKPEDERARIDRLYLLTVSRPPTAEESQMALSFLNECTADLNGDRSDAWAQLCHALFGSNSFLFCE